MTSTNMENIQKKITTIEVQEIIELQFEIVPTNLLEDRIPCKNKSCIKDIKNKMQLGA